MAAMTGEAAFAAPPTTGLVCIQTPTRSGTPAIQGRPVQQRGIGPTRPAESAFVAGHALPRPVSLHGDDRLACIPPSRHGGSLRAIPVSLGLAIGFLGDGPLVEPWSSVAGQDLATSRTIASFCRLLDPLLFLRHVIESWSIRAIAADE